MKKLLIFVVIVIMIISCVGCSSGYDNIELRVSSWNSIENEDVLDVGVYEAYVLSDGPYNIEVGVGACAFLQFAVPKEDEFLKAVDKNEFLIGTSDRSRVYFKGGNYYTLKKNNTKQTKYIEYELRNVIGSIDLGEYVYFYPDMIYLDGTQRNWNEVKNFYEKMNQKYIKIDEENKTITIKALKVDGANFVADSITNDYVIKLKFDKEGSAISKEIIIAES